MTYTRSHALILGSGILLGAVAVSAAGVALQAGTSAAVSASAPAPAPCNFVEVSPGETAATSPIGPLIPECQILSDAPTDGITAPTRAQLMTLGEADRLTSTGVVGIVPAETPVWVVTVHAPMTTMGSPLTAPVTFPVYSWVIDARTGWDYTTGIGSNALG